MFKNRAIQVRMVKSSPNDDTSDTTVVQTLDSDQINQIAKEQVKHIAIAVGAVIAGTKLVSTVTEIAIITAKVKIR